MRCEIDVPLRRRIIVWQELEAARLRILEICRDGSRPITPSLLTQTPIPSVSARSKGAKRSYRKSASGCCVGCGIPRDQETIGCNNCRARHHMRRLLKARREAQRLPDALPALQLHPSA